MSKHHHQTREEQINNRIHDAVRLQQENTPYQKNKSMQLEDVLRKEVADDHSIQLWAYELYCEKGGIASDNWLEVE